MILIDRDSKITRHCRSVLVQDFVVELSFLTVRLLGELSDLEFHSLPSNAVNSLCEVFLRSQQLLRPASCNLNPKSLPCLNLGVVYKPSANLWCIASSCAIWEGKEIYITRGGHRDVVFVAIATVAKDFESVWAAVSILVG